MDQNKASATGAAAAPVGGAARRSTLQTDKQDNISSKLLGTNVSQINIEKFREMKYAPPDYKLGGKINQTLLKSISMKFSIEVIFVLDISNQNLTQIDALSECFNLVVLNISRNQIRDLAPISKCDNLAFLNAASNNLQFVDALKNLRKLTHLHLEGNNLKNIKHLKGIEGCENLRNLYLQTMSGGLKNGICDQAEYRDQIFSFLLLLKRLDGIPKGLKLDNGEELVKKKNIKVDFDLAATGVYFTQTFPKIQLTKDIKLDGEDQLKQNLNSCQLMLSNIQNQLKSLAI